MAGTMTNPVPVPGDDNMAAAAAVAAAAAANSQSGASFVNSVRISAVTDRLYSHIRAGPRYENGESYNVKFYNLCLSLARGIDYAVAHSEIPARARELPVLLKLVCQRKNDPLLQAAVMVLMISVKSACGNGWFSDKDNEELQFLLNEISSTFCTLRSINTEECTVLPTISTIMTRFYPQMKMHQILAFVEVKSGYGAYVKDFHISKNDRSSLEDKIYLFVAQTDNRETSSCIISPQLVNFLLNGKGVERRTSLYRDPGPQNPTGVTHLLKYGTNLLQAVGQFNGDYIIVIAFMSMMTNVSHPTIPDYVQPAVAALDSDNEIIEGPSRISLNCPISFRRIKTPVKGQLCKHLQCFDYDNFIDINSRRPSWRCPHCNQSVCFTDIRMDQKMVKVLKEVGENVVDVIIAADGSWKAVAESDECTDNQHDGTPLQPESTSSKSAPAEIMDLTEGDERDIIEIRETDERKPSPADVLKQPNANFSIANAIASLMNCETNRQSDDDFWSGVYLSTQPNGGTEPAPAINMLPRISANAIFSAVNRETEGFQNNSLVPVSSGQGQFPGFNNMELEQYGNLNISNEYGRFPTVTRNVTRTPIAVQALPAQASPGVANMDRQQQFSRSHLSPVQLTHMPPEHVGSQSWNQQDPSFISSRSAQQVGHLVPQAPQLGGYRYSSAPPTDRLNSHQQQYMSRRVPYPSVQNQNMVLSSTQPPHLQRTKIHPGVSRGGISPVSLGNTQQTQYNHAATQRAMNMVRQSNTIVQSSRPVSSMPSNVDSGRLGEQTGNMGVTGQTARMESSANGSAEQNWRPTGRMRGSLGDRALSDASLSQYIIQPTPPVQSARPNLTGPRPSGLGPQLQALMANSMGAQTAQEGSQLNMESSVSGITMLPTPPPPPPSGTL